ncbi:MAG: arginine--tRNA ligase [Chitinophagaceae bacterium]
MEIVQLIKSLALQGIGQLFGQHLLAENLLINATKPEFEGDYTLVVFPLTKISQKGPEPTGRILGEFLANLENTPVEKYNVVKGFLNLTLRDSFWMNFLDSHYQDDHYGIAPDNGQRIMVEYSSPNTNKPLHLGHLRNNFLGFSIAEILKANGFSVIRANLINDRGIHICKSMISWKLFGEGATPESTQIKGDHLVGQYYVLFNDELKKQTAERIGQGIPPEKAEREAPIMLETQQMLQKWEAGDQEVRDLWEMMNQWVYAGFDLTYHRLGIHFDRLYYESKTYLLGKNIVLEGLNKGIFFTRKDGSVWVDLTDEGLDEKLLLRGDGTSVYITQDLGTAQLKYDDYKMDQSIYVIADEQNYHMKVLQLILKKLAKTYAPGIIHLSYGMVELPHGRMKSREGTVVDADDLIEEMVTTAHRHTLELGKVKEFDEKELKQLVEMIGLGAMKFFLLRVDPKKKMIFNPEESIDFHGFTGPFIQYTYARIQSILRKEGESLSLPGEQDGEVLPLFNLEKTLIRELEQFPSIILDSGAALNPSIIANYIFRLAQTFNSFYAEHSIQKAESEEKKRLRIKICMLISTTISLGMKLLGIQVPDRM